MELLANVKEWQRINETLPSESLLWALVAVEAKFLVWLDGKKTETGCESSQIIAASDYKIFNCFDDCS